MGIAESMKGLTEDILDSYDVRVKALGDIVADTYKIVADARETMKGFTLNRKKIAGEQAEALGNFTKDLAKNVSNLLKEFGKNRKAMSEKQAKILEELTKSLTEFSKGLTKNVNSMLNGFKKQHKDMSEELNEKLTKEIKDIQTSVKNIISNTQTVIGEYRSDMAKARRAWQGMAVNLAKSRGTGVITKIEAGEKADTGEEKGKKIGRKAKRGRR